MSGLDAVVSAESELQGNISPAVELQGSINHLKVLLLSAYGIAVKNGFEGTEEEWLESLKGEPGAPGQPGADGKDGTPATDAQVTAAVNAYLEKNPPADGKDGVGIKSVVQTTTSTADGGSNVVTVTKTDGTTSAFTVKNGSKGSKGDKGDKGDTGLQGVQGEKGETGATGRRGNSILKVTTAPTAETSTVDGYSYKYKFSLSKVLSESGVSEVLVGDVIKYSYYEYGIGYVGASYAFAYTRTSIRGGTGATGTSVTVSSVSESTDDGGSNVVTFSDGKTLTVKNGTQGSPGADGSDGAPGADGYTPVCGVDYYTEADKAEFSEYIASELAKRGQLKPEFANSIEECTDTSKLYVLPDGMIYAYMLTEKQVEVGGGDYTNILPLAVNADGTPYVGNNGEKGYKTGWRLNSSKLEKEEAGMCCTGFMPITPSGDTGTLRLKNITPTGTQGGYLYAFGSDKSTGKGADGSIVSKLNNAFDNSTGIYTITLDANDGTNTFGGIATAYYLRLSIGNINENTIITWNEEITEKRIETVKEYAWASTGHAFVPADYEDRIIAVEESTAEHTAKIAALEKAVESGSTDETETAALAKIKVWDKPVYDPAPVTLIADDRAKPALTTADRTIDSIYAKYRALMAAHPRYISETNIGQSASSDTFPAVDMLRFDFKEPDGLTDADYNPAKLHETKPKIIFMSGVHNEWVGVWSLYYALEEITTNPDFDDIRRNAHIIVMPCANPYGLVKPLGEYAVPSHVNANGVAIHNNFGVGWVQRGAIGEYNYSGTEPYSEPETRNIDAVVAENTDAIAFVSCHNNDWSTCFGAPVIWASSATYHMCNMSLRLIDKLSKAWLNKYGNALKEAIDTYKINMEANDYRLGRAMMSSSAGTEQLNATQYGIQATNLEVSRMMKVFSGDTDGTSEVMTHGAEVYANFMRTLLWNYDPKDKKEYAPNLPWSE